MKSKLGHLAILLCAIVLLVSCPSPTGGGGGGGGSGPSTKSLSITYFTGTSSSSFVPVAQCSDSAGQKTYLLGTYSSAGTAASINGYVSTFTDGTQFVFTTSTDGSLAYMYSRDSSGSKGAVMAKVSTPSDGAAAVGLYNVNWQTGSSSVLLSVPIDSNGVVPAGAKRVRAGATKQLSRDSAAEPDESALETAFNDAIKFFLQARGHFVLNFLWSLHDTINAKLSDSSSKDFLGKFSSFATNINEVESEAQSGSFSSPTKGSTSDFAAATQATSGYDSLPGGGHVEDNSQAGIKKIAGDQQSGATGLPLANNLQVIVVDKNLQPRAGVQVVFNRCDDNTTQTVTTDANGYAYYSWTLGSTVGRQLVLAHFPDGTGALDSGADHVFFEATAVAPSNYMSCLLNGKNVSATSMLAQPIDFGNGPGGDIELWANMGVGFQESYDCRIVFPANGNGTYSYNSKNPLDPEAQFDINGSTASWLGFSASDYGTYSTFQSGKNDITITVYQDSTKYWGVFHGTINDAGSYPPHSVVQNIAVTDGKFMYLK